MNNLIVNENAVSTYDVKDKYTTTLSAETQRVYLCAIHEFFGVNDITEIPYEAYRTITPDMANAWATQMEERGISHATINKKLSAMKNFYEFLCRRHVRLADYNPFDTSEGCIRYKNAQKPYSDKRALCPEEMQQLLSCVKIPCATDYPNAEKYNLEVMLAYRDKCVLEILAVAGLRRDELSHIKLGDISISFGEYIMRVIGKGSKERICVIPKPVMQTILMYVTLRGLTLNDKEMPLITQHTSNGQPNTFVSNQTIYRIVKKYADLSGLGMETISPHSLRHSYATNALQNGTDITDVQDCMGHANVSTTRRYDHIFRTLQNTPNHANAEVYGLS